jgi:molybdopterin synthase catalytic subunit
MSEVQIVVKQVEVCKESSEVLEALAHVIGEIKEGKDALTIAASSLPKVMTAVEGAQHIDDEIKAPQFADTVALGGAQIVKSILKKKA